MDPQTISMEIIQTIDCKYIVLVNGFQWGIPTSIPDKSGAYSDEFDSYKDAFECYNKYNNIAARRF